LIRFGEDFVKRVYIVAFLSVLASAAAAQNVKVKMRAALYDRDLNVKPVPHLVVKLVPAAPGAQPMTVQTTLDGVAELDLAAGKYKIVTEKPVELFDKSYRWEFDADFVKPENTLELSNDNAQTAPLVAGREARVDELAYQYKRVKDAVVTVWTEHGAYDAFVVDPAGLVMTMQRPLERATWLAVQIDDRRRLPAVIAASDKEHDIAVLRINLSASGEIVSSQLSTDPGALIEGERVFTVENPDWQKNKKLVSGVVSKADAEEIVSDVKSSYGSPLFNSSGNVVGVGRTIENKPMIQPIAMAAGALAEARQNLAATAPPSPQLLPTLPIDKFPFEGLRAPGRGHWEKDVYSFQAGDFYVELFTPVALYEAATDNYEQRLKEYNKHSQGRGSPPSEPEHKYEPVLVVAAVPKTKMPFWENMASGSGNRGPVIRRYKTAVEKLRLLCGEKELTPIWPGRLVAGMGVGRGVVLADESSMGRYVYAHDAASPQCGKVTLQIFSTKDPEHPLEKVLDGSVVTRIWQDFEPYRKIQAHQAAAPQQ
jgi:hypothetical protein